MSSCWWWLECKKIPALGTRYNMTPTILSTVHLVAQTFTRLSTCSARCTESPNSTASTIFSTMTEQLLSKDLVPLYVDACLLQIPADIAEGYRILLSGDETLAILAITQGNVIDACFGSPTDPKRQRVVKEVKATLEELERPKMIVQAYLKAFERVLEFHKQVGQLHFWNYCFHYTRLQHEATEGFKEIFQGLQESLQERQTSS